MNEIRNNESRENERGFIGYEYKSVTVKRNMEAFYVDGYTNFGWVLEGTSSVVTGIGSCTLKFKRDRKIVNKIELTRLQREFESYVNEIEKLENSKFISASTVAYAIGILGTVCMAGATFAYLGGIIPLFVVLAIPGFLGWILPYFMYTKIFASKNEKVTPLIDQQYDSIYDVCSKSNSLLVTY